MQPSAVDANPGVLLRLPACDRSWPDRLPTVPGRYALTISVGDPALLPLDPTSIEAQGYRIVGVAATPRSTGATIDVLIPGPLLAQEPDWVVLLAERAQRAFDLRMGPVQHVLAAELQMHRRGSRRLDQGSRRGRGRLIASLRRHAMRQGRWSDTVSLHTQIQDDLKTAMKARDSARVSALRMAIAAMKNRAVAEGKGPQGHLDDELVVKVLGSEVKRRREAAKAFRDAGREESAASEETEASVYEAYLPRQLNDEELSEIVDEAIAEVEAEGPGSMGAVMQSAMAKVAGRADGGRVSAIAKQRLEA